MNFMMVANQSASALLLLASLSFVPMTEGCGVFRPHSETQSVAMQYGHKSESELAAMTPSQRVDEFANEQAFHKYDVLDQQFLLISKFVRRDGLKAIPRLVEVIDEYDPTTTAGKADRKGERFDAMWMLAGELDNRVVRLRASAEGIQAVNGLARAIDRMRQAGYGREDQHEWAEHGRFEMALTTLEDLKGLNETDEAIQDTLRIKYRIHLSKKALAAFTEFLVSSAPTYPSWSERDFVKDYSQINEAGNPAQLIIMKTPDRYYQAYLQFKKHHPDR